MEGPKVMHLPRLVKRCTAREPVEAAGLRPRGAKGEVDLSVAVDVVGGDADVVARRLVADHRALLPLAGRVGGTAIPVDGVLRDDDDVLAGVAIDVGQGHAVADVARMGIDDPRGEGRIVGPGRRACNRDGQQPQEEHSVRDGGENGRRGTARAHGWPRAWGGKGRLAATPKGAHTSSGSGAWWSVMYCGRPERSVTVER